VHFGLDIPNVHHGLGLDGFRGGAPFDATLAVNRDTFDRLAAVAEEIGFHTVWVADHLVFPDASEAAHPLDYNPNTGRDDDATAELTNVRSADPIYEALTVMTWLGAKTTTCRIGVGVLVIPYRNPMLAAKIISTLDVLTGGRITIGAGVGWLKEAFDAVGADYEHRGAVTDEFIDVMRILWTEDSPEFEGAHYTLPKGLRFLPKPPQGTVPIYIGGVSGPALRRAAGRGDGWLSVYQSPDEFAAGRARMRSLLEGNGRDPDDFTMALRVRYQVVDDGDGDQCIGRPQHVADMIKAYRDVGVDHLQLAPPPGPTTDAMVAQVRRFQDDVLPRIADLWPA
jgi:probable F420-dependent oxidoreductase